MAYSKKILVVGELSDGNVRGITGELLGVGRRLADVIGAKLSILFLAATLERLRNMPSHRVQTESMLPTIRTLRTTNPRSMPIQ